MNTIIYDFLIFCSRLREERGDMDRALALDHKPRDLSSQNGEYYDGKLKKLIIYLCNSYQKIV